MIPSALYCTTKDKTAHTRCALVSNKDMHHNTGGGGGGGGGEASNHLEIILKSFRNRCAIEQRITIKRMILCMICSITQRFLNDF